MAETNYISKETAGGSVHISEDVLSTIVSQAVAEVEGTQGLATSLGSEIAERLGKKNVARGAKVSIEGDEITVDVFILVKYGTAIQDIAVNVQAAVASGVEAITGISVKSVNVTVCGIVFEKGK